MSGYDPIHIDDATWFYRIGDKLEFARLDRSLPGQCVLFTISYSKLKAALAKSRPSLRAAKEKK